MHVETIRCVADALASATYGVNVLLASRTRDGSDPVPSNVTVYDDTRHGWVSRMQYVPDALPSGVTLPALLVTLNTDSIEFDVNPKPTNGAKCVRSAEVPVAIHYLARGSTSASEMIDALYTLAAVRDCLTILASPAGKSARQRNVVRLDRLTALEELKVMTPIDDVIVAGAVTCTWTAHELAAVLT